jgi:flagellar motor switch protein FliM
MPGEGDRGGPKIELHDFTKPSRLSRPVLDRSESLHREAARRFSRQLSRRGVPSPELKLVDLSQLTPAALAEQLPSPTIVEILALSPSGGTGVLQIDPELGFALLNRLLGGGERPLQQTPRPLTVAEHSVLEGVIGDILDSFSHVWRPAAAFELSLSATAHVLENMHFSQPEKPLLSARFTLDAPGLTGGLVLALPLHALEQASPTGARQDALLMPAAAARQEFDPDRVAAMLSGLPIECRIELGSVPLSLAALAGLRPNDVILIRPADDDSVAFIGGADYRFQGRLLVNDRRLAVEIGEPLAAERR